jgi:hypothetical protein
MKFARIQFEDRQACARALYGLMQRGRVIGLRDHVFIVPAPALDWLAEEHLPYSLIEMLNHDDVVQTLRDNLAHAVQRRKPRGAGEVLAGERGID